MIGWLDLGTKDTVEHQDSIQILQFRVVEAVNSNLVAAAMELDLMAVVDSERRQAVDLNLIKLVCCCYRI